MKRLFQEKALPMLIAVQGQDKIEKVEFLEHADGLACVISSQASTTLSQAVIHFIEMYLAGNPCSLPPLDWGKMTPFTQDVLHKLASLPFGTTDTYGGIATSIGSPRGARAVGSACGRNPFPFFLPCHRVIGALGIGGFSAGLFFKKILLNFESQKKNSFLEFIYS